MSFFLHFSVVFDVFMDSDDDDYHDDDVDNR